MTATVSGDGSIHPTHWRGLSYDFYNGRGWALTTERQEPIAVNEDIPLPPVLEQTGIGQSVHWVLGDVFTRYTLGLPQRFNQDVVVYWRGIEDLSRVLGRGNSYSAVSQTTTARPNQLRQSSLEDVPPAVMARYTQLPDTIPGRVHQLAREAAGLVTESAQPSLQAESAQPVSGDPESIPSPYDQAKALERFLRQYPYSLEVELPPAGSDPVDFFLFELQTGYCDYYASAMVVMARSLGLPARLATGFLAQPAGENGVQTIYQINAHSWAEIYFSDYGWVEFEPTAAFPSSETRPVAPADSNFELQEPVPYAEPPPIPEPEPKFSFPYWLLGFVVLFPVAWWLWRRRQRKGEKLDDVRWAYSRLQLSAQRLGQPATPSQTPAEFEEALRGWLQQMEGLRLAGRLGLDELYPEIERLTAAFVNVQYAGKKPPGERLNLDWAALSGWRRIRGRLWLLGLLNRLQ